MRDLNIRQIQPMVSIPTAMATSMVQRYSGDLVHTERICTQIGTISIGSATPAGEVFAFDINPFSFPNTSRLRKLADLFANYKFRRGARLIVRGNLGTNVIGDMTAGFSRNPDLEVQSGPNASPTVFSLPGAVTANYWTPLTIDLTMDANRDWKFLDADSSEIMKISEGRAFVVVNTAPNVTNVQNIAVYLDCVIDFKGEQQNDTTPAAVVWPATTITSTSPPSVGTFGSVTLSVNAGEPAFPTMISGRGYQLIPQIEVPVTSAGEPDMASVISWSGVAGQYFFYYSLSDVVQNEPMGVYFTTGRNILTRSTINTGN